MHYKVMWLPWRNVVKIGGFTFVNYELTAIHLMKGFKEIYNGLWFLEGHKSVIFLEVFVMNRLINALFEMIVKYKLDGVRSDYIGGRLTEVYTKHDMITWFIRELIRNLDNLSVLFLGKRLSSTTIRFLSINLRKIVQKNSAIIS